MLIEEIRVKNNYTRKSKLGKEHEYVRYKTMLRLICDCCGSEFLRDRGSMDPNRINNNYYHVCSDCDAKKFAQQKGVDKRKIWNIGVNTDIPINKF